MLSFLTNGAVAYSLGPTATPRCIGARCSAPTAVLTEPLTDEIWKLAPSVRVQGSTLKTWDVGDPSIERVQLAIKSEGRPIDTDVQLWTTPDYVPTKFRIYTENGALRPVHAIIETPVSPKTVAVYNKASIEFPFDATVAKTGLEKAYYALQSEPYELVQGGGSVKAYTFPAEVQSVQVLLKTDERNMKAKIELTQGPNEIKQVIDLYASKGYKNPFYCVIQTPGAVNTIRIINGNTVEFPFDAWCVPYVTAETGPAVELAQPF